MGPMVLGWTLWIGKSWKRWKVQDVILSRSESGSEKVLKLMKRAKLSDRKLLEEKISLIKKYTKIRVNGAFILGFPGSSEEDDEESIKLALKLPLDRVAFNFFVPLPGSEIQN